MSQGTPMKEGRIERHLMRQRGAGVRTITADFGFSISFPGVPPVAQAHLPAEPPTKRRKTNEGVSPNKSNSSAPHRTQEECAGEANSSSEPRSERSVAQCERRPEQICHEEKEITIEAQPTKQVIEPIQKPAKKPTKARRKLCVEDEVEQEKHHEEIAPQAGGSEDTFIFGLKSNKRQPKCKPERTLVSDSKDHAGKVAPAKGKRTTKASKQAESKPIPQPVEELPVGTELAEEKPKTIRRKPTVKKPEAVSSKAGKPSEELPEVDAIGEESNNMTTSSDMTNAMTEKITDEKPEVIESKPLKIKTAPGRPKKRNLDEVLATVTDANIDVPEKASKRPRRQAAVSAIEKVTLSYEADLVPVDKLRRAPDLESKPERSRKAAAPEVIQATEPTPTRLPAPPPLDDHRCDSEEAAPYEPQPKKRGRKKAVKELDVSANPTDEEVHAGDHQIAERACSAPTEPQLKKRGRRKAVKDVELKENKVAEESENVGHQTAEHNTSAPPDPQPKKRGRKKAVQAPEEFDGDKVVEKSETITQRESEHEASSKDEKIDREVVLSKQTPPPARKGRQPGSKVADVNGEPVDTSSTAEDPEKGHTTKDRSKACTEVLESREKGTERTTASAAQQPKDIRKASTAKPSTKTRRALADFDGNIVRHPSTEGPKKLGQSFSPPMKQRSKHTGAETQPEPEARSHGHFRTTQPEEPQPKAKPRGRPKKARPDEEPANLLDTEPPRSTPRTSKKRHVIRANEDLDWLFEKAEPKRTHAAAVQQPKLKGLQRKDLDRSAKEMDLDDLLESIAGFSGKLSTGQRGRATATK